MEHKNLLGHILAIITIIVWGTTFVSTKVLLNSMTPVEIMIVRFSLGLITLFLIKPKLLTLTDKKHEITFMLAGLTGVTLYFTLENVALSYTSASNVSVIISTVPFFSALLNIKEEKQGPGFFIGFIISIIGIFIISFNSSKMNLSPLGDFLVLLAAIVWAFYSMFTKKIGTYNYNIFQSTRRIIIYGLIFTIPIAFIMGFDLNITTILEKTTLLNLIYLGIGASAMCFLAWNTAVDILGPVKTCVYLYAQPVITVIASIIILHEKITVASCIGIILTLLGLILSQKKFATKKAS